MGDDDLTLDGKCQAVATDVGLQGRADICIDTMPSSERILLWAGHLAAQLNARLLILHAWTPVYVPTTAPAYPVLLAKRLEAGERVLERAASYLHRYAPEQLLVEGPAGPAVVHAAHLGHVDLVVLGTRSRASSRVMSSLSRMSISWNGNGWSSAWSSG